jgi:hypothetical protein
MAREHGQEYNPETAKDLRPKDFRFSAYGFWFRYTLQIPAYILERLDSATMDKLYDHMNAHCAGVVATAIKEGFFHSDQGRAVMRSGVATHLRNYIWERFSIAQEAEGNECWQTAPTLQEVHRA